MKDTRKLSTAVNSILREEKRHLALCTKVSEANRNILMIITAMKISIGRLIASGISTIWLACNQLSDNQTDCYSYILLI